MAQTWLETCWLSGSNSHNNTLSAHPLQPLWGFLTIDLDLDDSACTSRAFMGKVSIRIQKSMQNAAVDWCVQSYRVTRQHKAHMSHAAMPLAIDKCDSFFVVISVGWAWQVEFWEFKFFWVSDGKWFQTEKFYEFKFQSPFVNVWVWVTNPWVPWQQLQRGTSWEGSTQIGNGLRMRRSRFRPALWLW